MLALLLAACDAGERPDPGPTPTQLQALAVPGDASPDLDELVAIAPADAAVGDEESQRPVVAQNDLDGIARAVLQRYLRDPETTPDGPIFDRHHQSVFVASDVDSGRVLSAAAVPSKKLLLRSMAELHAEADRTQAMVFFIMITGVDITGDEASLWVGVDFVKPAGKRGLGLCCCSGQQVFVRRGKTWRYKSTGMQACS